MRARTAPGSIGIRAIEPRSRPCAQLTSRPAHAPPHTTRSPIHIDVRRATNSYVADEELRRRVRRQLNKGESLHALRRNLFFAHQGHVRRRHLDDQIDQALCLTLITNACVLWTTTYLADALDALRGESFPVTDELAAHLTPAQHDHINFYGTYSFDIDAELRREGHRPLRTTA